MSLADLTTVWCEIKPMSRALDALPSHTRVIIPEPGHPDPVATAEPAQAVLAHSVVAYDRAVFARLPRVRILVRTGIGVDNVNAADATAHGVLCCNTPAGPTESTAEHTVALMLAIAKRVPEGAAQLARGEFASRRLSLGNEVQGKTLGLIGFGRIGQRVAEICGKGFGMRLLAYDPLMDAQPVAAQLALSLQQVDLDTLLAQSDFVSLHAPSIPSTRHLINRDRLARMKRGAYLLNLARGPLVDAEALLEALDAGQLAGAGLDVFDPEPLEPDSRLRFHPRIAATPHSATMTVESRQRIEEMAVEEILRFFQGLPPCSPLNPEAQAPAPDA